MAPMTPMAAGQNGERSPISSRLRKDMGLGHSFGGRPSPIWSRAGEILLSDSLRGPRGFGGRGSTGSLGNVGGRGSTGSFGGLAGLGRIGAS
jgi:hypothetical protein